jgi:hypothetical protein
VSLKLPNFIGCAKHGRACTNCASHRSTFLHLIRFAQNH